MKARGRWLSLGLVLASVVSPTAGRADTPCFDPSQPVTQPLVEAPSGEGPGDQGDSGETEDGRVWGRLHGRVAKPIERDQAVGEDLLRQAPESLRPVRGRAQLVGDRSGQAPGSGDEDSVHVTRDVCDMLSSGRLPRVPLWPL
jgi:hypothetical protein